ncbi:DUF362 domain-containing protein [Gloeothece verrucosa]|uniref:DUF362 domain-containing protein n=1 Tax=Gloeothece verrucosa (strain PCC 7822) TaxID=497965 RepID=E0U9K8_GLOV7|nr:DUF362 domain-containing protein [Gloeothece verrucosa]ADN13809.1 protein of unknown function DUF362 [Gloeothece verrucosa PCC 7822]
MYSVSLIRADSYDLSQLRASVEKLLEPLGGIQAYVKNGDRVLLKPNLLTGSYPQNECTTRKELVYCVAQLVIEAGGQPFLGDSPAFGSAKGVAAANGYLPLIEALNLPIVEFHGKPYPTESENFNHLRLSKEAMEADVIINLPKVKSHVQLTLTLGVKNLFGCVPGKMKAWWHFEAGKDSSRFAEMLVETAKAINPDLTIIDGIIGHQGNGPSKGEPRPLGILGASSDVFALDRVMVEVLGVAPSQVPTLAAQRRLGYSADLESINFPLEHPCELQISDWKLPSVVVPIDFRIPRVISSTFKHLYIRLIQEPLSVYSSK